MLRPRGHSKERHLIVSRFLKYLNFHQKRSPSRLIISLSLSNLPQINCFHSINLREKKLLIIMNINVNNKTTYQFGEILRSPLKCC